MKRILTCTALAAVLLVAAPAFGQTYTEQIEQTIDKQKDAIKDAEASKREVERRCEREIDR